MRRRRRSQPLNPLCGKLPGPVFGARAGGVGSSWAEPRGIAETSLVAVGSGGVPAVGRRRLLPPSLPLRVL